MTHRRRLDGESHKPVSAGAGLVALDIVLNGRNKDHPYLWAGGSCGNVLTILSYMGWLSYPIAYLGDDNASRIILRDMRNWGVRTDFIFVSKKRSTPIVVERIRNDNLTHVFEFKCPYCGSLLPKSRPIPRELVSDIAEKMPHAQVFYIDRVSKTAISLAKTQKQHGALIVFEPHRASTSKLFKDCLDTAHVVKYSAKQIKCIQFERRAPLEIQTLGAKGLRYRWENSDGESCGWRAIPAIEIPELKDSAGAGDWCTASIVHVLGQDGLKSFCKATQEDIEKALMLGQRLAALNCIHEGARGIMYNIEKKSMESTLCDLMAYRKPTEKLKKVSQKQQDFGKYLCPSCISTR